jgi:hypothetical protein
VTEDLASVGILTIEEPASKELSYHFLNNGFKEIFFPGNVWQNSQCIGAN